MILFVGRQRSIFITRIIQQIGYDGKINADGTLPFFKDMLKGTIRLKMTFK